jgi:hypothetical protein
LDKIGVAAGTASEHSPAQTPYAPGKRLEVVAGESPVKHAGALAPDVEQSG